MHLAGASKPSQIKPYLPGGRPADKAAARVDEAAGALAGGHEHSTAIYPADPDPKCYRCDQIGHKSAECSARAILRNDPKPPTTSYQRGMATTTP